MAKKRKLTESDDAQRKKLAEAARGYRRARMRESGSNEIRGKNQDAQIRAMWAKDPENPYED